MYIKTLTYLIGVVSVTIISLPSFAGALKSKISYQYSHNNNVMNAYKQSEQLGDQQHSLSASTSYAWQISQGKKLNLSAEISRNQQQKYSMLDNTQVELGLWYGWQNNFSYLAPFYIASVKLSKINSESYARDANKIDLTFVWNKRVTDLTQIRAGLSHSYQDAKNKVFEQNISQSFAQLEYQLTNSWQLHSRFNYAIGELIGSKSTAYCKDGEEVSAADYQGDYNYQWYDYHINQNLCGHWYSYNYDGRYYAGQLTAQYQRNAHKLSAKFKRYWVHADNSNTSYQKNEVSLSYTYKF
ncbi:hypothetical protein [Catenovulum agarivorans]|uniref:hypothetical protein n=1 Tax=Catenovulum agarivorans TaxID=1172192 RepID=UPI0002EF54B6|nr:hypothetical protein [Catenovulum agarivorans]